MKPEDILALIRAGYTKADIDAMTSQPAPDAQPETEPAEPERQTASGGEEIRNPTRPPHKGRRGKYG